MGIEFCGEQGEPLTITYEIKEDRTMLGKSMGVYPDGKITIIQTIEKEKN